MSKYDFIQIIDLQYALLNFFKAALLSDQALFPMDCFMLNISQKRKNYFTSTGVCFIDEAIYTSENSSFPAI